MCFSLAIFESHAGLETRKCFRFVGEKSELRSNENASMSMWRPHSIEDTLITILGAVRVAVARSK